MVVVSTVLFLEVRGVGMKGCYVKGCDRDVHPDALQLPGHDLCFLCTYHAAGWHQSFERQWVNDNHPGDISSVRLAFNRFAGKR